MGDKVPLMEYKLHIQVVQQESEKKHKSTSLDTDRLTIN